MISFIVPTVGRASLAETLASITTQMDPADEVVVAGSPKAEPLVAQFPNCRFVPCPAGNDWGARERTAAMWAAKGTHLAFLDDDDVYLPNARKAMADALASTPDQPVLFRLRWNGDVLWHDPVLREANVSSQMMLMPNDPEHLGQWGRRYEGDFDFLASMKWPLDAIVWRREVIADLRPPNHPILSELPQGWFHHGAQILALLHRYQPKRCVELGSWRGASAIAMATVLRAWHGTLCCVDTWMGAVDWGGTRPGPPQMLFECATNLVQAGVASQIRLIPSTTADAARAWTDGPIDFLYVDADHQYGSVCEDLELWWPHLKVGGLIAGDDYLNTLYPDVKRAWDDFEKAYGQSFEHVETPNTDPPGMQLVWGLKR